MESEIHWPVQSTLLLLLKEDGPVTMLMIFVYTSVIVVFSDKRYSHKTTIHVEMSPFAETSQRTAPTPCAACITCSEPLHTECVLFVCLS